VAWTPALTTAAIVATFWPYIQATSVAAIERPDIFRSKRSSSMSTGFIPHSRSDPTV
jgi:hypothetical protein